MNLSREKNVYYFLIFFSNLKKEYFRSNIQIKLDVTSFFFECMLFVALQVNLKILSTLQNAQKLILVFKTIKIKLFDVYLFFLGIRALLVVKIFLYYF